MHKEVMHDIKQLQDGLDITSGTDVFSPSRMIERSRRQQSIEKRTRRTSSDTQHSDSPAMIHRCLTRERDNDGSCSAENSRVKPRSSEGCKGERVSQKHQQQGSDAHNVGEMKKIEARNPRLQKNTRSETRTLNSTLEIETPAASTSTRP